MRHVGSRMPCDLIDIITMDWPDAKKHISDAIYGESDPIPVGVGDIGDVVASRPEGDIPAKLKWEELGADEFERLLFALISKAEGYENPEWLMHTNAPDKGRDLSVFRVNNDPLAGILRRRVIIQCKKWTGTSIGLSDISTAKEQVKLWEPPRVDVLVIATTGRFTADAVAYVERHNQGNSSLSIEMWPESHIERLLASRPALVAEFQLR